MIGALFRRLKPQAEEMLDVFVIAGLGNPGKKYEKTRHNCGFEAIDILAERYHIDVKTGKFKGLCGTGVINGRKVILVKPLTYMNLSGECIREVCAFYKADPEKDLVVMCDDISLPPGKIRIRMKGSAGGHNGLKSIIAHLGTDRFTRIKIGVGSKEEGWDLADYVLSRFSSGEQADMDDAFDRAAKAAAALATDDAQDVMNRFNSAAARKAEASTESGE